MTELGNSKKTDLVRLGVLVMPRLAPTHELEDTHGEVHAKRALYCKTRLKALHRTSLRTVCATRSDNRLDANDCTILVRCGVLLNVQRGLDPCDHFFNLCACHALCAKKRKSEDWVDVAVDILFLVFLCDRLFHTFEYG
jgi:hypothetical protein